MPANDPLRLWLIAPCKSIICAKVAHDVMAATRSNWWRQQRPIYSIGSKIE
ncbi:MAG: hypothetical protein H7Z11_06375 [Verrucomicrobia bacterium]|nr:hypothetical protein [Leptolyngbya sp. ES-bin-22]